MSPSVVVSYLAPTLTAAGFVVVQNALSLNALPDWDQVPACFVHPVKDLADGGNRLSTYAQSQVVRELFAVVTVCELDELEARRDTIRQRLMADNLPGRRFETIFEEGETLDLNRTLIWWRDTYSTRIERRSL